MLHSNKASFGAIALALASVAVLTAGDGADRVVTAGAKAAKKAAKALEKHKGAEAVAAAEQAVAFAPREAGYRMILGQSYLEAGRFGSAGQAFADTLELDGGNGRAALNLALTQVARGDWQAARGTLTAHADAIPAADRGLALALAGDTAGAVALLTQVARAPGATPKVRQNLALAYALGGQWGVARVLVAADLSPAEVDARLQQWAAFAQPSQASDQVASLLGVTPAVDAGQPVGLALNAAPAAPLVAPAPVAVARAAPVAPVVAASEPASVPVPLAAVASVKPQVVFAPPREVVQALPVATIESAAGSFKAPIRMAALAPAKASVRGTVRPVIKGATAGSWYVQLGAFDNAGVAKNAWGRATRRFAAFKAHVPQGGELRTSKATFFRLSVGGFSRADAKLACRQYKARGGACFVRLGAGDQIAQWARPSNVRTAARPKNVQLAMR